MTNSMLCNPAIWMTSSSTTPLQRHTVNAIEMTAFTSNWHRVFVSIDQFSNYLDDSSGPNMAWMTSIYQLPFLADSIMTSNQLFRMNFTIFAITIGFYCSFLLHIFSTSFVFAALVEGVLKCMSVGAGLYTHRISSYCVCFYDSTCDM